MNDTTHRDDTYAMVVLVMNIVAALIAAGGTGADAGSGGVVAGVVGGSDTIVA